MRPEIVGVRGLRRRLTASHHAEEADELFQALRDGKGRVVTGLVIGWYLAGRPIGHIFDGPVRTAMHRIGELWQHERSGILQEHEASLICVEAIMRLRELLPVPATDAPTALGGAPEGDFYLLPTLLAATTLREAGYRDRNFGANTPLHLLSAAAQRQDARLVWISLSAELESGIEDKLSSLASELLPIGANLVIGGRLVERVALLASNTRRMSSMAELAAFAVAERSRASG